MRDLSADTPVGEDLKQDGVFNPSIDDVGLGYAFP
jgi:hypothetical protein